MKAITLYQPWATWIAEGRKTYETRSFAPWSSLIGQRIAIHAGKTKAHIKDREDKDRYPLGAILCTAKLAKVYLIRPFDECPPERNNDGDIMLSVINYRTLDLSVLVLSWEDWRAGMWGKYNSDINRYGWKLEDLEVLPEPFYCNGKQGFWNLPPLFY